MHIVLLPGLLCDAELWKQVAFRLSLRGFEVTVLALEGGPSIEAMARAAREKIPSGSILIGHSLGARVAAEVASAWPQLLSGLCLVCMGTRPGSSDEAALRRQIVERARMDGIKAIAEPWADLVLSERARTGPIRQVAIAMALRMSVSRYAEQIEAFVGRSALEPCLAGLDLPTLVVTASEDGLAPPQEGKWAADRIRGGQTAVVGNAAHLLPLEQPENLVQAMLEWLGALASGHPMGAIEPTFPWTPEPR